MLFCGLSRQIMLGEIYSLGGFLNVAVLLQSLMYIYGSEEVEMQEERRSQKHSNIHQAL